MVPQTSGSTPNDCWASENCGVHSVPNTKSATGTSPKNSIVSNRSDPTISRVVTTDRAAAAISASLMPDSNRERAVGVRFRLTRTPCAPDDAARRGSAMRLSPSLQRLDRSVGLGGLLLGERDDLRSLGDRLLVGDHEVHEGLHLGLR